MALKLKLGLKKSADSQINNPSIPFRGVMPITLEEGARVTIAGTIPGSCKRFQVNFETQNGDRALHYNPRFEGTNTVVRNSRVAGAYGTEERDGPFPFTAGTSFVLQFIMEMDRYKILVNGAPTCIYGSRIFPSDVEYLTIEGDVQVSQIRYEAAAAGNFGKAVQKSARASQLGFGDVPSNRQQFPPPPYEAHYNTNIINTPPVPYRGYLPMAPGHGSTVTINGTIPTWCNRFQFNLETDRGDIAMHFNPRFEGTNAVIRNTKQNGTWGSEERHGYFPFQLGAPFEVCIKIEESHYKISVNHSHLCDYGHRIPKDYVRQLTIEGDIQLSQIRFEGGNVPLYNPPMPVNAPIPGGLQPGKMVRINGQTSYNPSRFNVNLVQGSGFHANADIGMHCDVRFNYGDSRNIVVRTHRERGSWGGEERHSNYFPFVPGQPFEMIVRAEHDKYMIAVNNQHMFEFRHRLHPMHRFDHLFIEGDVNISMVQFQ